MEHGDGTAKGIADLKRRLDEPATAEAVGRLLDRVDALESAVLKLTEITEQLPHMMSAVVDTVDDKARAAQQKGIDLDERLKGALTLAERITDPQTVAGVSLVVDLMNQAPGTFSMLMDMVDDRAKVIIESGIDIDARIASTIALGEKLTAPATVDGLTGVLQPGAVTIVGMLGDALTSCFEECMTLPEPRRVGPAKLLTSLRDHDVQRGLAFLINVARFFGQGMKSKHATMKSGAHGYRTDLDV